MSIFRNLLLSAALCLVPVAAVQAAETVSLVGEPQQFVLNGAHQFSLKSQVNGREYRIFVSAPTEEAPPEGFPVIYTSDGNAMFPQFAANANLLWMSNRAVLVGIGYPGDEVYSSMRAFDLTPKASAEAQRASGRRNVSGGGGNDLFIDFIENQLKPLIEKRYKINRNKQTLFGHSFGGLFVLHVLFNRPEAFQNYVAAAPSVWYNNQSILEEEKAFLAKYKGQKLDLNVLITANTDPSRRRPTPAQSAQDTDAQATAKNSRQNAVENSDAIVERLNGIEGVTAQYKLIENETHVSMVPSSINSALRFVLGDSRRSRTAPPTNAARGANDAGQQ